MGELPLCMCGRYGNKQSMPVTFLEDAHSRGAVFMDKARVSAVLHSGGVVQGVQAQINGKSAVVRARVVVVSCGSINSPALLLRSKVPNQNIGTNLRLHPVTGDGCCCGCCCLIT